jgi:hypothetical protein
MAVEGYIVRSSSGSAGLVTLYHGSALVHCNTIAATGVNYEQLLSACEGAYGFCTSTAFDVAKMSALLNNLVRMEGHPAAVIRMKLSQGTVDDWVDRKLAREVVEDQAYEFLDPNIFPVINRERTDVAVRIVTDNTVTFDEK